MSIIVNKSTPIINTSPDVKTIIASGNESNITTKVTENIIVSSGQVYPKIIVTGGNQIVYTTSS